MKIKTVRKWSESADPKKVDLLTWVLAAIMAGCYVYMGYLITLL